MRPVRLSHLSRTTSSTYTAASRLPARSARPSRSPRSPPRRPPPFDPSSLRARFLPFETPAGMSWSAVLQNYARMKDPERELDKGVLLRSDEKTLVIFDGFEKAKYHFLVMPRDPFPLPSGEKVPPKDLDSLNALLSGDHALEVLKELERQAEEVKETIQEEMVKKEGWAWDVQVGFHAAESMKHVHLHVISGDLISPKLKNKKHYNSFHPTLGFFLPLADVLKGVEDGSFKLKPAKTYEALLKEDLVSFYDQKTYANIPKLKAHLEAAWEKLGRKKKKELAAKEAEKEDEDGGEREKKRQKTEA